MCYLYFLLSVVMELKLAKFSYSTLKEKNKLNVCFKIGVGKNQVFYDPSQIGSQRQKRVGNSIHKNHNGKKQI